MSELKIAGNDFFVADIDTLHEVPYRPGVLMIKHTTTDKAFVIHTNELNNKLERLLKNDNNILYRAFELFMKYCDKINDHNYKIYWMKQRASKYNLSTQAHVVIKSLRRHDKLLTRSDLLDYPEVIEMPVAVRIDGTNFIYYDIKNIPSQRIDAYLPDIIDAYFTTIVKQTSKIGQERKAFLKDYPDIVRNDIGVSILSKHQETKQGAFNVILEHRKNNTELIVLPSAIFDDRLFSFVGHLPF